MTIQTGGIENLTDPVLDVLCDVDAGDFAPDLTIGSMTDSTVVKLAIRGVCTLR